MKRIVAVLLAIACVMGCLSACGTTSGSGEVIPTENVPETAPVVEPSATPSIEPEPSTSVVEPETIPYSKGVVEDSVYINEWADIRLELPENYYEADEATYASLENPVTECGMCFLAEDNSGLIYVSYEKLPPNSDYTEATYYDAAFKNETPGVYATEHIGGYDYLKAMQVRSNGAAHTAYARKLKEYMIVISVIGKFPYALDVAVSKASSRYTQGELTGSTYTNEWADIKLEMPEGFVNASAEQYSSVETTLVDCGVYYVSEEGSDAIYIGYERVPSSVELSAVEVLDIGMEGVQEEIADLNDRGAAIVAVFPEEYTVVELGGYSYLRAEYTMSNESQSLTGAMYTRALEDYYIMICVYGADSVENDSLAKCITSLTSDNN